MSDNGIPIKIEFSSVARTGRDVVMPLTAHSGGLEILFGNQKKYTISLPTQDESGTPANVAFLVRHLCDKLMKDPRKELFVLDDTV